LWRTGLALLRQRRCRRPRARPARARRWVVRLDGRGVGLHHPESPDGLRPEGRCCQTRAGDAVRPHPTLRWISAVVASARRCGRIDVPPRPPRRHDLDRSEQASDPDARTFACWRASSRCRGSMSPSTRPRHRANPRPPCVRCSTLLHDGCSHARAAAMHTLAHCTTNDFIVCRGGRRLSVGYRPRPREAQAFAGHRDRCRDGCGSPRSTRYRWPALPVAALLRDETHAHQWVRTRCRICALAADRRRSQRDPIPRTSTWRCLVTFVDRAAIEPLAVSGEPLDESPSPHSTPSPTRPGCVDDRDRRPRPSGRAGTRRVSRSVPTAAITRAITNSRHTRRRRRAGADPCVNFGLPRRTAVMTTDRRCDLRPIARRARASQSPFVG